MHALCTTTAASLAALLQLDAVRQRYGVGPGAGGSGAGQAEEGEEAGGGNARLSRVASGVSNGQQRGSGASGEANGGRGSVERDVDAGPGAGRRGQGAGAVGQKKGVQARTPEAYAALLAAVQARAARQPQTQQQQQGGAGGAQQQQRDVSPGADGAGQQQQQSSQGGQAGSSRRSGKRGGKAASQPDGDEDGEDEEEDDDDEEGSGAKARVACLCLNTVGQEDVPTVCDTCGDYYHNRCVGVNAVVARAARRWTCPLCSAVGARQLDVDRQLEPCCMRWGEWGGSWIGPCGCGWWNGGAWVHRMHCVHVNTVEHDELEMPPLCGVRRFRKTRRPPRSELAGLVAEAARLRAAAPEEPELVAALADYDMWEVSGTSKRKCKRGGVEVLHRHSAMRSVEAVSRVACAHTDSCHCHCSWPATTHSGKMRCRVVRSM